jgi:hypothetical protein
MDSTRTSRREFLLASVATAMALPSLSASPQSASGERIIPFSFRASDGDLMDLKRRLDQSRWPERETGVGWEQGPPLAADFHFTSPIDNALDRATYLQVCWPNSAAMVGFNHIYEVGDGDRAFIVYEALTSTGKRFRNSEVYIVREGKLLATEVYFGWDLPHRVPQGAHVENEGQGHG